jgi:hypothetical protein
MVAKTFTKFMEQVDMPADIKELQVSLKKLGYADFKKISSKRFSVLTNENRVDLLEKIAQHFSVYGAVYDQDFGSSSVGMVRIGAFAIGAAPKSKQGKASAGIQNEYTLINMVNTALADGPLNLVFQAKGKKFTVPMAVRAEAVGGDTKDRKKSDVNIIDADGNKFPLSLKKDKAEMWESADSYWGKDMETIVRREQKAGTVKVEPHPKVRSVFTLTPNLAVKANSKELINVVFGTDILPNGCVLEKTFSGKYKVDADTESVIIDVTKIITSPRELKGEYEVYFLMRNDSSRKGSKIPGLRVLAVKKSRINKNVKVVNR